ncbi:MAG: phosphate starvation-inducible protein PhoH, partial [Coxiella sp. (in: Bacteria)]
MSKSEHTRYLELTPDDHKRLAALCGPVDDNLHYIERQLGVEINNRGNQFEIIGIPHHVDHACATLKQLFDGTKNKDVVSKQDITSILRATEEIDDPSCKERERKLIEATLKLRDSVIKPRTP